MSENEKNDQAPSTEPAPAAPATPSASNPAPTQTAKTHRLKVTGAVAAAIDVASGTKLGDALTSAGIDGASGYTFRDAQGQQVDVNAAISEDATFTAVKKARGG